ncbi:MAG TPA: LuxR C-terminal-related transcriptional regulator [Pseudomonas sp.]|uniref:helix-turn-helix transcriptional regulator n=1 Tax=Pseudomonas sp. TaxID=306 RepID=UPI002B46DF2F|nr:LuxR C-terminal-related transcriptional regulator [Pseudomonas sp.]HKS14131.1 LuxR C-terminal-related transcriptional regulator [Pseudomonas sp.]
MNAHSLFPQIGKVIASTGSRHFPRMLHDLIRTQLSVDATHIRQVRVEQQTPPDLDATVLSETVFCEPDAQHCPLPDPARLDLARRKDDIRYEISVYRANPPQGFSARERSLLEAISPLLLPMLEKHIRALQPEHRAAPPAHRHAPVQQGLQARFTERLDQAGLTLSERELQVCVGLLAGHTAPELADRLNLKASTVDSYLKRAAIKLGISGRHSLMRWMYGGIAPAA